MRSQTQYIVTKDEVHGHAHKLLCAALQLEYKGNKCTDGTVIQVLLVAAARIISIFAACRDLSNGPCDQTIRNALASTLPEIAELECRLNTALTMNVPKALFRKSRAIAIDVTLIPYHGTHAFDPKEIYRSAPKSGTTHFHAYATAVVVHKGYRYTLAMTRVEKDEKMKAIVERLLSIIRSRGVKIKLLLLDKGFFSVEMINYLHQENIAFIIPAIARGPKPKRNKKATGLRALLKQKHGYYEYTITGKEGRETRQATVTICVASKYYKHERTGRRKRKPLLFAISGVRLTPIKIRELYRARFGIETSYRQMHQGRIRTCTRDPKQRLLFVGIALILRNIWAWLHFSWAKEKQAPTPTLFLELLRFREMLQWIAQVAGCLLGAGQSNGIEREIYERLTSAA